MTLNEELSIFQLAILFPQNKRSTHMNYLFTAIYNIFNPTVDTFHVSVFFASCKAVQYHLGTRLYIYIMCPHSD